jgi:transposase
MSEPVLVAAGIAVANAQLDVGVRPSGAHQRLAHDADGIGALVTWLQVVGPQVMVVEATGG